jgi:hypothetical protein
VVPVLNRRRSRDTPGLAARDKSKKRYARQKVVRVARRAIQDKNQTNRENKAAGTSVRRGATAIIENAAAIADPVTKDPDPFSAMFGFVE